MCGKVGPLAKRASGKQPGLCRCCYQKSQSSRKKCGVCGRMRRISRRARDGQPDMCNGCVPKDGPLQSVRQDRHADPQSQTGRARGRALPPSPARARVQPLRPRAAVPLRQHAQPVVQRLCACHPANGEVRVLPGGTPPYKRTPGGPICRRCYRKQGAATGTCTGCGAFSSITRGLCESCILERYVQRLRDGGKPEFVAVLEPYLQSLECSERPRSTLMWAEKRQRLLDEVVRGEIALTHEALDAIPASEHPPRTIAFMRAGLVHAGVLGERDEILTTFTNGRRASSARWSAPLAGR